MLYNISYEKFLLHMIDYFTPSQLCHLNYCIISSAVVNGMRTTNVHKYMMLYPAIESVTEYNETGNMDVFKKQYSDVLNEETCERILYEGVVGPSLNHHDIVLIYRDHERFIIDNLTEHIFNLYKLKSIDLDSLFTDGFIEPMSVDIKRSKKNTLDIIRKIAKSEIKTKEMSQEGRASLVVNMTPEIKKQKLKEMGFKTKGMSDKALTEMLYDNYICDDNIEGH